MAWAEYVGCKSPSLEFHEGAVGYEVCEGLGPVSDLVQRYVADISQEGRQEQRIVEIGEEGEYAKGRELPSVKGPQHMAVVAILYAIEDVHQVIDICQHSDCHGDGYRPGLAGRGPNGASEPARHDGMDYRPQRPTSLYRTSAREALVPRDGRGESVPTALGKNDFTYLVRMVEHVVRLSLFKGPLLTVV